MRNKKDILLLVLTLLILSLTGCTVTQKKQAQEYFESGDYENARKIYGELGMSKEKEDCTFQIAKSYLEQKEYEAAIKELNTIPEYEGTKELLGQAHYEYASSLCDGKDYVKALEQAELITDYEGAKELLDNITYQYAISLHKEKNYKEAIIQLEKIPNYDGASDYMNKCRMMLKYAKFKYGSFKTKFDELEPEQAKRTKKEIRKYIEDRLAGIYSTWYSCDNSGNEIKIEIDKFFLDGKEYGMLNYDETNGMTTFYEFYYLENEKKTITMSISPDLTFSPVTDTELYSLSIGDIDYTNIPIKEIQEYTIALEEYIASQPLCTKEQVYERVQEDLKAKIYNGMNVFDAIGTAVSVVWNFEPVEDIQYSYDASTKIHTVTFYVQLSEYGLKNIGSQQFMAKYYEDDDGNLSLEGEIYIVE